MSKRSPRSGKPHSRAPKAKAPRARDIESGLNTFLKGKRDFQRAHVDGMTALRKGDAAGVQDAIKRERDVIEQQREVIARNRTKKPRK